MREKVTLVFTLREFTTLIIMWQQFLQVGRRSGKCFCKDCFSPTRVLWEKLNEPVSKTTTIEFTIDEFGLFCAAWDKIITIEKAFGVDIEASNCSTTAVIQTAVEELLAEEKAKTAETIEQERRAILTARMKRFAKREIIRRNREAARVE